MKAGNIGIDPYLIRSSQCRQCRDRRNDGHRRVDGSNVEIETSAHGTRTRAPDPTHSNEREKVVAGNQVRVAADR